MSFQPLTCFITGVEGCAKYTLQPEAMLCQIGVARSGKSGFSLNVVLWRLHTTKLDTTTGLHAEGQSSCIEDGS